MDIDIVVLWVDGSDPEWRNIKKQYITDHIDESNGENRFRDWGLMKFWFRSIEQFMPWIRKIHFVTWGHIPNFLNEHHPKLHIVRHQDFMPEKWLPTFNSRSLEMNMYRIPDLTEHFVYFNDDTFVLKPMTETDFFRNGLPCTQATEIPICFTGRVKNWQYVTINDLSIINKWFSKIRTEKKYQMKFVNWRYHWYDNIRTGLLQILVPSHFTGFKNFHCANAFCKNTFEELWIKESDLLNETSSHKFRDKRDINQWLALWWQIASGSFMPIRMDYDKYDITETNIQRITSDIRQKKLKMICLNDPDYKINYTILNKQICNAFESILPNKCSFEKSV